MLTNVLMAWEPGRAIISAVYGWEDKKKLPNPETTSLDMIEAALKDPLISVTCIHDCHRTGSNTWASDAFLQWRLGWVHQGNDLNSYFINYVQDASSKYNFIVHMIYSSPPVREAKLLSSEPLSLEGRAGTDKHHQKRFIRSITSLSYVSINLRPSCPLEAKVRSSSHSQPCKRGWTSSCVV